LQVFRIFDRNSNGKISADDLQVLRDKKIGKIGDGIEEVLKEVNCFNAAGISFEEFLQILTSNKLSN
jgi:Ca2+-binding EF-hand superfamily protein